MISLFYEKKPCYNSPLKGGVSIKSRKWVFSPREKEILDRILELAIEMTGSESGSLLLKDESEQLYIAAGKNIFPEHLGKRVDTREASVSALVFETGKPLIIDDRDSRNLSRRRSRLHSSISLPVSYENGEVVGVLNLNAVSRRFSEQDVPRLEALAESIALLLRENFLRNQRESRIVALSEIISLFGSVGCFEGAEEVFERLSNSVRMLTGSSEMAVFKLSAQRPYRVFRAGWPAELSWGKLDSLHQPIKEALDKRFPGLVRFNGRESLLLPMVSAHAGKYVLIVFLNEKLDLLDLLILSIVATLAISCLDNLYFLKATERFTRERERNRLARELHDGLAQILASLQIYFHFLEGKLPMEDAATRSLVEKIKLLTSAGIEESRFILSELKGSFVSNRELESRLEEVVQKFIPPQVKVQKEFHLGPGKMPFWVYKTIVSIVQEALSNVQKHARAHEAKVIVEVREDGKLYISIEDDGVGFSPSEVRKAAGEHFGLTNLRTRVRLLRGRLRVLSSPGKGTKVRATIPLEVLQG